MNFDDQYDPLCCCEYFDRNNERNHILGCCCNCVDFDQVFEKVVNKYFYLYQFQNENSFLCCRPINKRQKDSMLSTMFDRIRIPWRGGAKLISWECLVPFILNATLIYVATYNLTCTLLSLLIVWLVIMKANKYFATLALRGRFHYYWALSTALYLLLIFEITLPLYEFLPEENIILMAFLFLTVALFYRTKALSTRQKYADLIDSSSKEDDTKILISDNDENSTRMRSHRSQHNEYYNCWIDAFIDQSNQKYYICGLISAIVTFIIYSDLTLTAVCHPYLLITIFHVPISVPDDCSDIYDLYDVALGYIGGLYASLVCLVAICYLIKYVVLIYFGRRHHITLKV